MLAGGEGSPRRCSFTDKMKPGKSPMPSPQPKHVRPPTPQHPTRHACCDSLLPRHSSTFSLLAPRSAPGPEHVPPSPGGVVPHFSSAPAAPPHPAAHMCPVQLLQSIPAARRGSASGGAASFAWPRRTWQTWRPVPPSWLVAPHPPLPSALRAPRPQHPAASARPLPAPRALLPPELRLHRRPRPRHARSRARGLPRPPPASATVPLPPEAYPPAVPCRPLLSAPAREGACGDASRTGGVGGAPGAPT